MDECCFMFVPLWKDLLPATWRAKRARSRFTKAAKVADSSVSIVYTKETPGEGWTILQKVRNITKFTTVPSWASLELDNLILKLLILCHHWVISIMILIFIQLSWCQTLRILAIALILLSIILSPITLTIIVLSWNFCPLASGWKLVNNKRFFNAKNKPAFVYRKLQALPRLFASFFSEIWPVFVFQDWKISYFDPILGFLKIDVFFPGRRRRTNLQTFVKVLLMMFLRWQLVAFLVFRFNLSRKWIPWIPGGFAHVTSKNWCILNRCWEKYRKVKKSWIYWHRKFMVRRKQDYSIVKLSTSMM